MFTTVYPRVHIMLDRIDRYYNTCGGRIVLNIRAYIDEESSSPIGGFHELLYCDPGPRSSSFNVQCPTISMAVNQSCIVSVSRYGITGCDEHFDEQFRFTNTKFWKNVCIQVLESKHQNPYLARGPIRETTLFHN